MKKVIMVFYVSVLFFLIISSNNALALSSQNYSINEDSMNSGGASANSSSYNVSDVIGQSLGDFSASQNFLIFSGSKLSQYPDPASPAPVLSYGGGGGYFGGGSYSIPLISNFFPHRNGNDIVLSWTNPNDANFAGVKILRSKNFFPANPNDGALVYSGKGIVAIDASLTPDTDYFYSAFSYDLNGNFSNTSAVTEIYLSSLKKPISNSIPKADDVADISQIEEVKL